MRRCVEYMYNCKRRVSSALTISPADRSFAHICWMNASHCGSLWCGALSCVAATERIRYVRTFVGSCGILRYVTAKTTQHTAWMVPCGAAWHRNTTRPVWTLPDYSSRYSWFAHKWRTCVIMWLDNIYRHFIITSCLTATGDLCRNTNWASAIPRTSEAWD